MQDTTMLQQCAVQLCVSVSVAPGLQVDDHCGIYSLNLSAFYFSSFLLLPFLARLHCARGSRWTFELWRRNLVVMWAVPKTLNPVCRRTETFTPLKWFSVCFQRRNSSRDSSKGRTSETPQETWQPLSTAWIVKGRPLSVYLRLLKDQVSSSF